MGGVSTSVTSQVTVCRGGMDQGVDGEGGKCQCSRAGWGCAN